MVRRGGEEDAQVVGEADHEAAREAGQQTHRSHAAVSALAILRVTVAQWGHCQLFCHPGHGVEGGDEEGVSLGEHGAELAGPGVTIAAGDRPSTATPSQLPR